VIAYFPVIFLVTFMVPLAFCIHIVSLRVLLRGAASEQGAT